jgi:hypothetical protein
MATPNYEDIDLTRDRIFTKGESSWVPFFTDSLQDQLQRAFASIHKEIKQAEQFQKLFYPWWTSEREESRGDFFGFRLRDAYQEMFDPFADHHWCERCGAVLQVWDWHEDWRMTQEPLCVECRRDLPHQIAEEMFTASLFHPKAPENMRLP